MVGVVMLSVHKTLSIMTLSIRSFYVTLSITMLCYDAGCPYDECRILFTVMLNVIMLSVAMLNVIMLGTIHPFRNYSSYLFP
jgi:hypothetical protein